MALRRFLDIIGCARLNKTGRGKLNTEGGGGFNPRIKPAEPAGASAPEGRLSNFYFETGIVPQPLQPIVNRALPLVYEMLAAPMDARTRKRHSDWEWRFILLRWSLASQTFCGRRFIHRAFSDFPDRFIPFEGRCFGGCSCRASAVLGLAGLLPAALSSLALIFLQLACQWPVI